MWANHHVKNIWDARVDRKEFEGLAQRLIDKYFTHPSYYKIDGNPVFSIYDLQNLIQGFGGVEETTHALQWFRDRLVKEGFPGLHLQFVKWGEHQLNLSGLDEGTTAAPEKLVSQLGFDSSTHYQFVHFTDIDRDYNDIILDVVKEWGNIEVEYDIPYFPHISLGWDNNPRFKEFKPGIVKNVTPENVRRALEKAREYVDAHPNQPPLLTINSWNEWTETSYLQPDDLYGYGYLEAVKRVFLGT